MRYEPAFELYEQVRLKLACSATEASRSLGISDTAFAVIILSRERTTKVLIRLRGCIGLSVTCCSHDLNTISYEVAHV